MNNFLNNINYDVLLEYLSYLNIGTYTKFKECINNLDYDDEIPNLKFNCYSIISQMFSRLGHIEFDYQDNKFSVCPSTLVLMNKNSGILAGVRNKELINNIQEYFQIETTKNYNAPAIIKVYFSNVDEFSYVFPQIRISKNFSTNLLNILPTINMIRQNLSRENEYNFNKNSNYVEFFDVEIKKFRKINETDLDGLYKEEYNYGFYRYYLCYQNKYYLIDKNYGIYIACNDNSNNRIINYQDNKIIVPVKMPLPELIDRAITMCSGQNPLFNEHSYIYDNINNNIAFRVSTLLGQNF